jgi:hypothetical protein
MTRRQWYQNLPELEGVVVKEITNNGRKTLSMTMTERAFSNVSSLFSPESLPLRGVHPVTTMGIKGYQWTLFAKSHVVYVGDKKEKRYYIYGSCGDSTFGLSPSYYTNRYRGNIMPARTFYKAFLKYITENKFKLMGEKFGL